MDNFKPGELSELAKLSGIPRTTVRRYLLGGEVRVSAAKAIDAVLAEETTTKPAAHSPKAKATWKAAPKRRNVSAARSRGAASVGAQSKASTGK